MIYENTYISLLLDKAGLPAPQQGKVDQQHSIFHFVFLKLGAYTNYNSNQILGFHNYEAKKIPDTVYVNKGRPRKCLPIVYMFVNMEGEGVKYRLCMAPFVRSLIGWPSQTVKVKNQNKKTWVRIFCFFNFFDTWTTGII